MVQTCWVTLRGVAVSRPFVEKNVKLLKKLIKSEYFLEIPFESSS